MAFILYLSYLVASYFLNQYSCRTREVIMESVLITGASGFIGSFIVEEALKRKLVCGPEFALRVASGI